MSSSGLPSLAIGILGVEAVVSLLFNLPVANRPIKIQLLLMLYLAYWTAIDFDKVLIPPSLLASAEETGDPIFAYIDTRLTIEPPPAALR